MAFVTEFGMMIPTFHSIHITRPDNQSKGIIGQKK